MAIDNFDNENIFGNDPELDELIKQDVDKNREENTTTEDVIKEDAPEVETEKKEDDVLTNTEDQETELKSETKDQDQSTVDFTVESFNRKFETSYTTEDDIKSLFESSTELEQLRASLSEKDKMILEKEELLNKKTDGLRLFADDNMYKVNQALINNPDLNKSAILQLASANVDEMSDEAVLKLKELVHLGNGNYDEETISYAINKKYGLTGDPTELEGDELRDYRASEFLRNKDSQAARKELKELMNIEVPERVDLLGMQAKEKEDSEKAFAESLDAWKTKSQEVINSLDKYIVEYDKGEGDKFEFAYDDKFKDYLSKNLPEYASRSGLDPNKPESLVTLKTAIEADFRKQKEVEILRAFKQEIVTKLEDEAYKKKHNVKDPSTTEAPDVLSGDAKKNKEVNDNVLEGLNNQEYF